MSTPKHIGHQVVAMMDRLGVSPLTRNYHLFYSCIANSNPAMRHAVRNLGRFPSQSELDRVIDEYCPEAADSPLIYRHENAILRAVEELSSRLQSEHLQMASFHNAMERVTKALSRSAEQDEVTADLLLRVLEVVSEVGAGRVASGHRALARMDKSKDEVGELRRELIRVRRLANTDELTGLANRRHFDNRLANGFDNAAPFCLILGDIDHFKRVNDAYGHPFGDQVLRSVAQELRQNMPQGAFLARTGGEEFSLIVHEIAPTRALSVADQMRKAVALMQISNGLETVAVSMSLGVAMSADAGGPTQLYEAADAALYRSKNAGRNRSTLYDPSGDGSTTARYKIYGD